MELGTEGYSPGLIRKIEYAGGNSSSFRQASEALKRLADLPIDPKHVSRITGRLGQERLARRNDDVKKFKAGTLKPPFQNTPSVAVVEVDAGKCQLRDEGSDRSRTCTSRTRSRSSISCTCSSISTRPPSARIPTRPAAAGRSARNS